jgi:ribonuclease HII
MIVGIDEVGRGPWAGPLVVSAVILGGKEIPGLTDSKKLTAKQRESYALHIRYHALDIGIGWISNRLIDAHGLSWALTQATTLAVKQLTTNFDEIIIDGTVKFINDPRAITMKKADLLIPSVSAASIIAKVARDRYMHRMHAVFPHHGFNTHVGYGTAQHRAAIKEFGVTPLHRLSFAPLMSYRLKDHKDNSAEAEDSKGSVTDTAGHKAEQVAAEFLEVQGFQIMQRNWRTKWCEIDIIAEKAGIIHFVEVKYRKTDYAGDGLTAITPKKLTQMKFSAQLWQQKHGKKECRLSAISLESDPILVAEWLPNIL